MLAFGVLFFTTLILDRYGLEWRECEVKSSRVTTAGSRGMTFAVTLDTSCGSFGWTRGVGASNAEEIAAKFEPGVTYEFEFGMISRRELDAGWNNATAHSWRKLP